MHRLLSYKNRIRMKTDRQKGKKDNEQYVFDLKKANSL